MLEARRVWFSYDQRRHVLRDISLEIREGTYVAIMGENGAGKSTLIKHFNGLLKPTRGEVYVDGLNVAETPTSNLSRRVALVFQNPESMFFSETVYKEAAFALKNLGFPEEVVERQVMKYLELFGLQNYIHRSPFTLSSGEQRRLAFSCILAWDPKYVVLDEPTAGQDRYQRELLKVMIKQMIDQGKTVIIVSHDVEFVAETMPKVFLMADGEILSCGGAKQILSDEATISRSGLIFPQITETLRGLDELNLPRNIISPEEAADRLVRLFRGARVV